MGKPKQAFFILMFRILIVISYLCLTANIELHAQNWQLIEKQNMPEKISNNAVVGVKIGGANYVYSFSGIDSTKIYSGISNRGFKYDVQLDRWDTVPPLPDSRTKIAAAASFVNDTIYIIGGYSVFANGSELSSDKVHRFDPSADTFLTDGTPIPIAIDDHVQAVYKDSLVYVITGWSNTTNVNNVQIYDTYNDSWEQGTSVPFNNYRVFGASGTIIGDTIYYYGGASRFGNFPLTNYLRKGAIDPNNPAKINWQTAVPDTGIFNYRTACASVSANPIWFGGSTESYNFDGIAFNGSGAVPPSNHILQYDVSQNQMQLFFPDSGIIPMDLRGIASISDSVKFIAGGMLQNQTVSNKSFLLKLQLISGIVEKQKKELQFKFFPNPFKEELNLINQSNQKARLQLFSSMGKLFLDIELQAKAQKTIKPNLEEGIYFLKIIFPDHVHTEQLIHIQN